MLCGRRRRLTFTGSPAQNNRPSFLPALLSPHQLDPTEPPIVDQNWVAHHAVRLASTLHLQREPCLNNRPRFLACPSLSPSVGPSRPTHCRSASNGPSCCAVGAAAAPLHGALLRTTGPVKMTTTITTRNNPIASGSSKRGKPHSFKIVETSKENYIQ